MCHQPSTSIQDHGVHGFYRSFLAALGTYTTTTDSSGVVGKVGQYLATTYVAAWIQQQIHSAEELLDGDRCVPIPVEDPKETLHSLPIRWRYQQLAPHVIKLVDVNRT